MIIQTFNDPFVAVAHPSLKEAFKAAENDKTITKIRMTSVVETVTWKRQTCKDTGVYSNYSSGEPYVTDYWKCET